MTYSINNKPKGNIFFSKRKSLFCIFKALFALLFIFCNNGLWAQKGNKLEVYKVSTLGDMLDSIDINNRPNLQLWTAQMQNAIETGSEEIYNQLLNLIENENL